MRRRSGGPRFALSSRGTGFFGEAFSETSSPLQGEAASFEELFEAESRGGYAAEVGPRLFQSRRFQGDAVLDLVLNNRRELRRGNQSSAVAKIQQALLDLGYPLPVHGADGKFGPETHTVVVQFQTDQRRLVPGFGVDGVVGDNTMERLDRAIANLRVRKDVTALTPTERTALATAINALKTSGVYNGIVSDHANSMPTAHRQPAFLPWHRQFILNYESELRAIDPTVSLPYWNWATDSGVVGGSAMWNSAMVALMGGDGTGANNAVTTGPFSSWRMANSAGTLTSLPLQRRFGVDMPTLPTVAQVTTVLGLTPYDAAPWDTSSTTGFRNNFEGWIGNTLHNLIHQWVGGAMNPGTSPNDPCFFLHHCFVDKIWADWQAAHPTLTYLPTTRQTRPGLTDAFGINDNVPVARVRGGSPATFKPAEVLDNRNLKDLRGTTGIIVRYV